MVIFNNTTLSELADITYSPRYTYMFAATIRATNESSKPTFINGQTNAIKGCFDRRFPRLPERVVFYHLATLYENKARVYL